MCKNNIPCGPCSLKKKLNESKIAVVKKQPTLTDAVKNQLIKEAKNAVDALYKLYDVADKNNLIQENILNSIDESFEHVNETLNLLITESVVGSPKKKINEDESLIAKRPSEHNFTHEEHIAAANKYKVLGSQAYRKYRTNNMSQEWLRKCRIYQQRSEEHFNLADESPKKTISTNESINHSLNEAMSPLQIDKEINSILAAIQVQKAKMYSSPSFGKTKAPPRPNPAAKDNLNRLIRRLDTLNRKKEQAAFMGSIPKVKAALKKLGLKRSVYNSTAIRGYSIPTRGYEFSQSTPNRLDLNGLNINDFTNLVSEIKSLGVHVEQISEPAKVVGQGTASSITFR